MLCAHVCAAHASPRKMTSFIKQIFVKFLHVKNAFPGSGNRVVK